MKNIIKSIVFLGILLGIVAGISIALTPKCDSNKYSMFDKANYEVLQERQESIDVLVLGDSLIYSSINPLQIWHEYGYTMFDCAEPAYIMSDAYKHIKVAVDYQKPKMIVMEGNMLFRDPNRYPWNDKLVRKIKSLVPIYKYHDNWKKVVSKNSTWLNTSKGYKLITKTVPSTNYDYMKYSDKVRKFPDRNEEWFKKILNLCKENNIEFLLVTTPTQESANYPRRNALVKLSEKLDFKYVDLNLGNPAEIDWTAETKDKGAHLNYKGANKVSHYFGEYLKNTYNLEDHRNDEKYAVWNTAYEKYLENYQASIK